MAVRTVPSRLEESEDDVFPSFDTLVFDFFSASKRTNADRLYEVLRYRYGLEGQSSLTLEEVGIIFGITRERARQLEDNAKGQLKQLLHSGHISAYQLNVRIHPTYYERLEKYRITLDSLNPIELEGTLIELAANCFGAVNVDTSSLRLLLELYGHKRINLSHKEAHYAWALGETDPRPVQRSLEAAFKYLRCESIAKPFDDILLNVNRAQRSRHIERSDVELALALSNDIEQLEDNLYQVKYERLRTITDKIFRVLHVHGEPMHGRDIARRANSEAFERGEKLRMDSHNVGSRLSADERFEPIGRSGEWALVEWEVETDPVRELMKDALHASGEPLSSDQIYQYVSARRPVRKSAINSYLSYETEIVRVGKNLFALESWGMQSVSPRVRSPRNRTRLSKAKIAEYIELIFLDKEVSEMYVSDLAKILAELGGYPKPQAAYGAINYSPATSIVVRREGNTNRRVAVFNPSYRSLLSKKEILTKDIPLTQLIQNTVREILRQSPHQTMLLSDLRDKVSRRISCPPASVYTAIAKMGDIQKRKSDSKGKATLCVLDDTGDRFAESVKRITDVALRAEVNRALRMLHVDTVDVALFQLGKLFENTIRHYILAVESNEQIPVTKNDRGRLFDMINWAARNNLIADRSALHYLRMERNDRAHGSIPNLDEREALLATSPQVVEYYLEYIILFLDRIRGFN